MLKKRIIPCLDVKDGRVVKGINFIDLVDAGDPVEQAKFYSENGADEICFLDISASLEERDTMLNVLKKTAEEVFIPLTVGGGIKSIKNIRLIKEMKFITNSRKFHQLLAPWIFLPLFISALSGLFYRVLKDLFGYTKDDVLWLMSMHEGEWLEKMVN